MGKVVVMISVSLDGFIAGPNGEIDWHQVDNEIHAEFNGVLARMGAFLEGRVMWELMASVWPFADDDPAMTPGMLEFAPIWVNMPKFVYSRTLQSAGWNTTVVPHVDADEVRALKAEFSGDLALAGADIAAEFQRLGLIDEYRLYVVPVALGRGKPLFAPDGPPIRLRLLETKTFGNGTAMLRYATTS